MFRALKLHKKLYTVYRDIRITVHECKIAVRHHIFLMWQTICKQEINNTDLNQLRFKNGARLKQKSFKSLENFKLESNIDHKLTIAESIQIKETSFIRQRHI